MACSVVVVVALLISQGFAADVEFSYQEQNLWPDICVNGNEMRQSPIDIVLANVQENGNLTDLELDGWDTGMDGVFSNTGDNVQFDPNTAGQATVRNHLGTYDVLQFHMHWGNMTGQGSEHTVDGDQAELEIHFVQKMQGASDNTARDYLSVIGVLADVDPNAAIEGPWAQLDAMAVQPYQSNTSVMNFQFDQLLPDNLDYWYYEGSLTTPLCSEIVAWFVLKERITVPGAYLDLLRGVQADEQGTPLTFNFRMTQAIGDRTVTMQPDSESGASPTTYATPMITLLAAGFALVKMLF